MSESKFLEKIAGAVNAAFIAAGSVCVIACVYLVFKYAGAVKASDWMEVLSYGVVPAIAALGFFAATRLRPAHKVNVVMSIVSVAATLYLREIVARVWFQMPSVMQAEQRTALAKAAM